jgi:cyclase
LEKKLSYLRIIPSLLLNKKKFVKGQIFSKHRNAGYPSTTCLAYESQKADELLIMDIDSYKNRNIDPDFETLNEISKNISTPITFGGGIKNIDDAKRAFAAGADKIYLNTILFKNINIISEIKNIYGSQAIMAGLNIISDKNNYFLLEDSNKTIDIINYIKYLEDFGVGEIKINFVNNEGLCNGMDVNYSKIIMNKIKVPCIFEGGVGKIEHIIQMIKIGATAIALGTILTFKDYNIYKIKQELYNYNFKVRY